MDDDYAQGRDVNADLAEITDRLGEPDGTHRTNPASVAWRFALGVLIVIASVGLHYLVWGGVIPWPRNGHLFVALIAGMFIGPGVGLYLIAFATRGRKLWVLTYSTGLFVWHRGRVVAFPWDEIKSIQIAGTPDKAAIHYPGDADNPTETAWIDLSRSGRRVLGTMITITRADGEQVGIPSTLADFAALGHRVQLETYRRQFPALREAFHVGQPLLFGTVICTLGGISLGKEFLPWSQVESVQRASDKLEVKKVGKKKAWGKCAFNDLVNPHLLMGIVVEAI
ncbi:MAG TPA: DUF6585 family protein [Gemmataceae bacterium]|jgi:hypothetical protein|nr:DUF6585 family protein [Gemmataceae bacterium]